MPKFDLTLLDGSVIKDIDVNDAEWGQLDPLERELFLSDLSRKLWGQKRRGEVEMRETVAKEGPALAEQQTGLPVRLTPEGKPAELFPNVIAPGFTLNPRFLAQRQETVRAAASVLEESLSDRGYKVHYVEPERGNPIVAIQEPGRNDLVLLDYALTNTPSDWTTDPAAVTTNLENVGAIVGGQAWRTWGLIRRIGAQALGGFLGGAADYIVNRDLLNAKTGNDATDVAQNLLIRNMALSTLSEGAMLVTGKMPLYLSSEGREMVEVMAEAKRNAKRMGVASFGAVTADRGVLARFNVRRSAALSYRSKERLQQREKGLMADLKFLRDEAGGDLSKLDPADLADLNAQVLDHNIRALSPAFDRYTLGLSATEYGNVLKMGEKQMTEMEKAAFSVVYEELRDLGKDAVFDFTPALASLREIKQGVIMPGRDPAGKFITVTMQKPPPVVLDVVEKIEAVSREAGGKVGFALGRPAIDGLRALDGDLRAIATSGLPGQFNEAAHFAGKVRDIIRDVIDNPVSGDPTFAALWAENRLRYQGWQDLLDISAIKRVAIETEPGNLTNVFAPENARAVSVLMDQMPAKYAEMFRSNIVDDLLTNPGSIETRLDSFVKGRELMTMRKVIDEPTETALRQVGRVHELLQSAPAREIVKIGEAGERILSDVFSKGIDADTARTLKGVIDVVGRDSQLGRALAHGLHEYAVKSAASSIVTGGLDPRKFARLVDTMDKAGVLTAVLKPEEARNLVRRGNAFREIATSTGADAGTQIAAAQQALEAGHMLAPTEIPEGAKRGVRAVLRTIYDTGLGWVLMSAHNERIMLASARRGSLDSVRAAVILGTRMFKDSEAAAASWLQEESATTYGKAERGVIGLIARWKRMLVEEEAEPAAPVGSFGP